KSRGRFSCGVRAVAMTHREALEILAQHRGQRIVIPTMASIAIWPRLSDTPLDFAYMPSAMGQGPTLGLGLALAQPERGVIVLNIEGRLGQKTPPPPRPMAEQIARLKEVLQL